MRPQYHPNPTPPDEKVRMMILQLSNPTQRIRKIKTSKIRFETKLSLNHTRQNNPSWQILQTLGSVFDRERFRIIARNTFYSRQTKDSLGSSTLLHSRRTSLTQNVILVSTSRREQEYL